jgi:predicted GTPase
MRQAKKVSRLDRAKKKSSYTLTQTDINPPRFDLTVNRREDVHASFINLVEKAMRQKFDLNGTPISITLQRA